MFKKTLVQGIIILAISGLCAAVSSEIDGALGIWFGFVSFVTFVIGAVKSVVGLFNIRIE